VRGAVVVSRLALGSYMSNGESEAQEMESAEFIVGVAIVVGTLFLSWAGRPSGSGTVRRFIFHPLIEPYFPVIVMWLLAMSAILIALGLGVAIGPS
jgi:hypothetical protein